MKKKINKRENCKSATLIVSQCCKCGSSYTRNNRHRQLGMQTNWWTVKETFSVSSVICTLLFITCAGADMVTSRPWHLFFFCFFETLNFWKPFHKTMCQQLWNIGYKYTIYSKPLETGKNTVKRAGQGSRYSFLFILMHDFKKKKKKHTGKQNYIFLTVKPVTITLNSLMFCISRTPF